MNFLFCLRCIMLALTLYQPMAFAVIHRGKDIENRDWQPSAKVRAERPWIAIHAGQKYEESDATWLRARGVSWSDTDIVRGAILGIAKLTDVITHSNSKWFIGRYGWCLSNITPLTRPLKVNGQLSLWYTGQTIEDQIKEQLRDKGLNFLEPPMQGSLFDVPKPLASGGIRQIDTPPQKEITKDWRDDIERDSIADNYPYKSKGMPDADKMRSGGRKK